jgi:hypothetical protein
MGFGISVEQEMKIYLDERKIAFEDNSSSFRQPDFMIKNDREEAVFHLEVKEKRQRYNLNNWHKFAPEPDLFITDDLSVRKCLAYAPKSGILVRDNIRGKYVFFSVTDLMLIPRKRVNRPIHKNHLEIKGKWLINLRNGKDAGNLADAFVHIRTYLKNLDKILFETKECYGNYVDEIIDIAGITRNPSHWETDVKGTR